jgi:hypothetical protein
LGFRFAYFGWPTETVGVANALGNEIDIANSGHTSRGLAKHMPRDEAQKMLFFNSRGPPNAATIAGHLQPEKKLPEKCSRDRSPR